MHNVAVLIPPKVDRKTRRKRSHVMPMPCRHVEHFTGFQNKLNERNVTKIWKTIVIRMFNIDLRQRERIDVKQWGNRISSSFSFLLNSCCSASTSREREALTNESDRRAEYIFLQQPEKRKIDGNFRRWVEEKLSWARRFCFGSLCNGEIVCFGPIQLEFKENKKNLFRDAKIGQ